jgi:hypothetical protein
MKKSNHFLIGAIASLLSACTHSIAPIENIYVYTFAEVVPAESNDPRKLIERFLGARDVSGLYRSDENTVYYVSKDDVNETFEQDLNNGNFTYNKGMKKYMGEFAPQLPSSEVAAKVAQEFLAANSLAPMQSNQLKVIHIGGVRSNSVPDGKSAGPIVDKLRTVSFGRAVDGIPVFGPGSKIVVKLGDKGEVTGLIRRWRELNVESKKAITPSEINSQQEAEEMANRQIVAEYGKAASFKIINLSKAYYDNNGKILQPVYIFETTINLPNQRVKSFNYLCVVPMLKQSPEPLNLTATDPRAKKLIKSITSGEKVPRQDVSRTND